MKYKTTLSIALALALSNQPTYAGSIDDSYAAGDTLTASKMENIKSAVNDNNSASRFYGDGSANALTIASDTNWSSTPPDGNNLNFTDIVIDAGNTLTVPPGTTIRCSGTFTNNGSIIVNSNANHEFFLIQSIAQNRTPSPGRGDTLRAASNPRGHTALGVELGGGDGGIGIPKTVAASSFNNFKYGGGAGAGAQRVSGGSGGGLLKVYCKGGIINNGTISADGRIDGGGAGIVILASSTAINNDLGSIQANGGDGAPSDGDSGAGGGGGGGIILLVAPEISNLGVTSITGGNAGTGGTTITQAIHSAGGGGGASGGNGGRGGRIDSSNIARDNDATDGNDGYVLEINANPAHMM